jgi:hypothetical protein
MGFLQLPDFIPNSLQLGSPERFTRLQDGDSSLGARSHSAQKSLYIPVVKESVLVPNGIPECRKGR